MTTSSLATKPIDLAVVRTQVNTVLDDFLRLKAKTAADHQLPAEVTETLAGFLSAGGKRLRPQLCVTGWHAAGGHGDLTPVLQVAASLEMLHAFCLIHDDIMDNSATRRGQPTVHRALAHHHADGRSPTAADHLGASSAILIGDLALTWADELLHTAGLTPAQLTAVLPLIDAMRTEVMYGQYLDVTTAGAPTDNIERALAIIRYKTAKYTIERPLHIGAALAGANAGFRAALSAFAVPLGEAFQLRDDLLGVYGNPDLTGKSALDDLREAKHTVLIALALQHATTNQRHLLTSLIGDPDLDEHDAARIRHILTATSARNTAECMIQHRCEQAQTALDQAPFPPAATTALQKLGQAATARTT